MKHELNWAHNTIFVFPPLFVCMPLHLLDALALVLKDDRCRCHILDLLGISGKTKSGTDKGNLYHCIRSYQQIKDHQSISKYAWSTDGQRSSGYARMSQSQAILHDSPSRSCRQVFLNLVCINSLRVGSTFYLLGIQVLHASACCCGAVMWPRRGVRWRIRKDKKG